MLENKVCELQDDNAMLAQALLRARGFEDVDDDMLLARLPSKHSPNTVVQRLIANPFFRSKQEKSRKRKAAEEAETASAEAAIKTEEGADGGGAEDTIVVESHVNGLTKLRKR